MKFVLLSSFAGRPMTHIFRCPLLLFETPSVGSLISFFISLAWRGRKFSAKTASVSPFASRVRSTDETRELCHVFACGQSSTTKRNLNTPGHAIILEYSIKIVQQVMIL